MTHDRGRPGQISRRAVLAGTAAALPAPAIAQGGNARLLRFVPHTSLTSLDQLWSNALISAHHSYMVYDQLFGIDAKLVAHPQMLAGYEVSADGLHWKFALRDGLAFHDGEPVLARDCVASIIRWSKRDLFGMYVASLAMEVKATGDRSFELRINKPFAHLAFAMGSSALHIMPERIAVPDVSRGIREAIGSGPYRFLADEWDSGAHVAYARNEKYMPRKEAPDVLAGGKVTHFDRVEWKILPEPNTAANALIKGEVDWLERPHTDHVGRLRSARGITVQKLDPFGWMGMVIFNLRRPPFDNPTLRRAVLLAMDQKEYLQAVIGDYPDLVNPGVGWFTGGTPLATLKGVEHLAKGPDIDAARRLVKESGYDGARVVHLAAGDIPINTAMGQMTAELYRRIGLNVVYTSIDWGMLVARIQNPDPGNEWASYNAGWTGITTANPGGHRPMMGNVPNPQLEALRTAWLSAPDLAAQQRAAEALQVAAAQAPGAVPFGQYFLPHAHRSDLTGFTPAAVVPFWGVRRA
jgi:peptide/nickel transport system substrate-binding protein